MVHVMATLPLLAPVAIAAICTGCGAFSIASLNGLDSLSHTPVTATAFASSPALNQPAAPHGPGRWRRAPDGLFYIKARVNGVAVRFLVDTGASMTVLTANDAARVGATGTGAEGTLSTVGGPTPMRWATLRRVTLHRLAVGDVSAAILSTPGGVSLLGQDVLRQARSVSIEADELQIS